MTGWRPTGYISGATVWDLHATHGFSVELSIPLLADRGVMVTWLDLLAAAERDGANVARMVARITDIVGDAYPAEVAAGIRCRLDTANCAV